MIDKEIGYIISHEESHYAVRTRRILAAMRRGRIRLFSGHTPPLENLTIDRGGYRRVTATSLPPDPQIGNESDDAVDSLSPAQHDDRLRHRYGPLTQWMDAAPPLLLMVDGAVESVVIARPYGVPTIIMREHGDRYDAFHLDLYDAAHSLVAPFPAALEQEETPDWVRRKTLYCGGIVSVAHMLPRLNATEKRTLDAIYHGRDQGRRYLLVIDESHGGDTLLDNVIATAQHLPEWEWLVVGGGRHQPESLPANVITLDDVRVAPAFMRAAQIVVAAPDPDTLAQIAFAGARYICIPAASPYNGQQRVAELLARFTMATVLDQWAPTSEWRPLLREVMLQPSELGFLLNGGGARAVAEHIETTAREIGERR